MDYDSIVFPNVMFESDALAMESLSGVSPMLNSFVSTLALSRVGYPPDIQQEMSSIHFIPGFAFFFGMKSEPSFYRFSVCHPFLPSALPESASCSLHLGLGKYDFFVQFMSDRFLERSQFYEYYPVVMRFGQAEEGLSPPKGGQYFRVGEKIYLRLFHHTDAKGKKGITSDRFLAPSRWNFCGTRELRLKYCYLTDIPRAARTFDTLPLLMRTSAGTQIVFRTDDQEHVVNAGVKIDNRDLSERVAFLVAPELIQPNPMIYHLPIQGQPTWLEIEFTRIYRCPCNGLRLLRSVEIEGEVYWVLDASNAIALRTTDPITWANGNNTEALLKLIDDCHID